MRKTLLIVCEGQTEKCYFESFPVRTVKVEVVNLEGQSKLKLVECAEEMVRGEVLVKLILMSVKMKSMLRY